MTRDEIIELVVELVAEAMAGEHLSHAEFIAEATRNPDAFFGIRPHELTHFAAMVAAAEREACLKGGA